MADADRTYAKRPPQIVGQAHLTCGQPPNQPASAQASPKREDLTRTDLAV